MTTCLDKFTSPVDRTRGLHIDHASATYASRNAGEAGAAYSEANRSTACHRPTHPRYVRFGAGGGGGLNLSKVLKRTCRPVSETPALPVTQPSISMRCSDLTREGAKQLKREIADHEQATAAIQAIPEDCLICESHLAPARAAGFAAGLGDPGRRGASKPPTSAGSSTAASKRPTCLSRRAAGAERGITGLSGKIRYCVRSISPSIRARYTCLQAVLPARTR